MLTNVQEYASPLGILHLVERNGVLIGIIFDALWEKYRNRFENYELRDSALLKKTRQQLTDYFDGKLQNFDLPIYIEGTEFQKRAWLALQKIPYGTTRTYREQAVSIGSPKAVRAVGAANGLNLLPIVLPCHRVVGSDGKLTGYAGGTDLKKFLIELEARH